MSVVFLYTVFILIIARACIKNIPIYKEGDGPLLGAMTLGNSMFGDQGTKLKYTAQLR